MSDKKPIGADQPKCQCQECGSKHVVCNGRYQTKTCGLAERFVCRSCGHSWKHFQTPRLLLDGMGIRERGDVVLRTFALVCLGLSLDQVEGLTGRKSETIRGWLLRCIKDPSAWPQIANSLVSSFHVRTAEIKALSTLLLETAQRQGTFHTMTRRRVIALLKAKTERRRLSPAEHLWLRSKRGMNTEPGQDTEVAYRQFVRLYKRPRLIPLTFLAAHRIWSRQRFWKRTCFLTDC